MLKLHGYYKNGALLQRNKPINIVGWADGKVDCLLKGGNYCENRVAMPDEKGKFIVELPPCNDCANDFTLKVVADKEEVCVKLKFGDVYLALGQSNMSYCVGAMMNRQEIMAEASNSEIYSLDICESNCVNGEILRPATPQEDFSGDWQWKDGKDSRLGDSSGVAIQTLLHVYNKTKIPVGVVNTSLGGVSIDSYIPAEIVEGNKKIKQFLKSIDKYIAPDGEYNIYGGANYTQMSGIFNEKIAPLIPFSFSAILWYQGENAVLNYRTAKNYEYELIAIINCYRNYFDNIPFICSNIALDYYPYGADGYNYINESIDIACAKTGAISFPLYDADNDWLVEDGATYYHPIHPVNKFLVAERFYKVIDSAVYGNELWIPPYIKEQQTKGNKIILTVYPENVKLKKQFVTGFTICGKDNKYVYADAKITGDNTVEVSSPYVAEPTGVTYAFGRYNNRCNLMTISGDGVKQYRTTREDIKGKAYYQLNPFSDCTTLTDEERNFGADLGCIGDVQVWKNGVITRTNSVELSIISDDYKNMLEVDYNPSNKGYYFFGISPEINVCGYDIALERYSKVTLEIMSCGKDVEFWGMLIRSRKGEVYRFTGKDRIVQLSEGKQTLTVSLTRLITADLGETETKREILKYTNAIEFYFRSKNSGRMVVNKVRIHD